MNTEELTLDELINHYREEFEREKRNIYIYDEDDSAEHFTEKVEKYTRQAQHINDDDER